MKVAKFDILYPPEYLKQKQKENRGLLDKMDLREYLQWLHGLKMGLYDIFGREWAAYNWTVYEYYQQDRVFLNKLSDFLGLKLNWRFFLKPSHVKYWWDTDLRSLYRGLRRPNIHMLLFDRILLKKYIEKIKPDIIFLREPCQIDNLFWKPYKDQCLVATMIGCNISHPMNWLPHTSDIIFTLTPEFVDFFNLNRVESYQFAYGTDAISDVEAKNVEKKYDITFVGKLGSIDQVRKSDTMEAITKIFDFIWWGPKGEIIQHYPALLNSWQGLVAGKDMSEVYQQSKIVVNDYVHSNGEHSVNMRMTEVMGAGAMLLTREAVNTGVLEENECLITYTDIASCLAGIKQYLNDDEARKKVALNGLKYVREHYNYKKILGEMHEKIEKAYWGKFPAQQKP